jgi:hypothetical protein
MAKLAIVCKSCKTSFLAYLCQKRQYCSKPCRIDALPRMITEAHKNKSWGYVVGQASIRKIGLKNNCKVCDKKFDTKPSRVKGGRGKYCSRICKNLSIKGVPAWNKGRSNTWALGDKNVNWKGGTTDLREKLRKSIEYEEWRHTILERDMYTCQICLRVGGYLEVDHIKPFSLFPELRLDIDNGRVLCKPCHKDTDSYLNSNMKREDFIDGN